MNNLLVLLTLLIICLGSASGLTCYFCANCPVPFNPYASSVREVPSDSGYWAVKKSTSSQHGALATRGPAEYGLCYFRGCRWLTESTTGRQIYSCCCTSSYCNTGSKTSKLTITVFFGALALLAVNRYV
ncbi:unnamed protein product [Rotaria sordida]|uniref:Uncharacterized protein n=1 Tax=Rotaria sordida TaxID=392033 RepID=A0A815HPQ7_9BILA|nr:unnamed protein product [Rotaria sordida]